MKQLAALVLLMTSLGTLPAATDTTVRRQTLRGLKIEYTTVSTVTEVSGSTRTSTERSVMFMDPTGRERIESRSPNGALRVILNDVSAGTMAELDTAGRRAWIARHDMETDAKTESPADGSSGRRPTRPLGTRVIQDLACEVRGDERIEVAFCVEPTTGLSIIGAETVRLPAAVMRRTIASVEVLALDPGLFEIPADYAVDDH